MASKPVPLAERFKEMILAGGSPAPASSEDPLDSILAAGAREKQRAALDREATVGSYEQQKAAKAKLEAMAAADEKAVFKQAQTALRGMSDAQLDAVDVGALSLGDRKAYTAEQRRRKSKYEAQLAAAEAELDEADGVITLDDGYDSEAAGEEDAPLEFADDDAESEVDQDEVSWVPPLGFGYEGAEY